MQIYVSIKEIWKGSFNFAFVETGNTDKLIYQIALTLMAGIGDVNARRLLAYTGSLEAVFTLSEKQLTRVPGIGPHTARMIIDSRNVLDKAEKEAEFVKKNGISTSFFTDKDYPARLKQCIDSPALIYHLGNADLNAEHVISIVGTRNASTYGRETCQKIVAELSDLNPLIVSGLALGIDTAAHRAAIEHGLQTAAVMGTGLDRIYPALNSNLAHRILKNGSLLTDFTSGNKPDRENFPKRNRIVAGLADATLVIEAGVKGGALITANIASSYNRDVFAIPGRLTDEYSAGCNKLIRNNIAALIQSADDIKYFMGWLSQKKTEPTGQKRLFANLSKEDEMIVSILQAAGECSMDKLCSDSGLTPGKVAAALLNLEFENMIKSLPGKMYKLT